MVALALWLAAGTLSAGPAEPFDAETLRYFAADRATMPPGEPARRRGPAGRYGFGSLPGSVQVNVIDGMNIFGDAANEPSLAVDPTNPNRMAIGWRQFDTVLSNFRQAGWAFSQDAGRSWVFPGVLEAKVFRSDPVLESSPDGVFYYNSLEESFVCDLYRSTNHGQTWPESFPAFGGDKAWMAVDPTDGVGRGNLYCAWSSNAGCCGSSVFTRSLDGGATWMTPIAFSATPIFGTLDVGPKGEVYVCGRSPGSGSTFRVARSDSVQNPADPSPSFDPVVTVNLGGSQLTSAPVNPAGLAGQAWIAVDRSDGPWRGSVYMLCSVDPPGADPLDVNFIRSLDGGQTWSAPVRVNDDPPGTNAYQWFGTMAVAPNGRIDVIFNDTRNSPTAQTSQLMYTYSYDGGHTWDANTIVSLPFDSHVGWPMQNKIGDYYDMVSDNVGANVAYAATFNGEQDVYFLRIGEFDCNADGVPDPTDLLFGYSTDFNGNGIPDECDFLGDANCDDLVNLADIPPFVQLLVDPAGYAMTYPSCPPFRTDIDGSGLADGADIRVFVRILLGP
ncbi:MAG: sialidase family protein [Phycisphaerae bacterium]